MLISADGEKVGNVPIAEAIELAKEAGLDLVQVSNADANPVVCKLLDYGKHLFDKKKNISSSKGNVKRTSIKEIKFRPSTDVGDYEIKLKKIKSFILNGDKTKISVRFRGREILNSDMGLNLLNKVREESTPYLIDIKCLRHSRHFATERPRKPDYLQPDHLERCSENDPMMKLAKILNLSEKTISSVVSGQSTET